MLFVECVTSITSPRHTVIHGFPLPRQQFLQSPLLFRKALEEDVDSEWSQHKKIIPVSPYSAVDRSLQTGCLRGIVDGPISGGGLAGAISKHAPYFCVEFGVDGGFAHVIEEKFPVELGHQLVCSLTDQQPDLVLRERRELSNISTEAKNFRELFDKHNWTRKLKINQLVEPGRAVQQQSQALQGDRPEPLIQSYSNRRVAQAAASAQMSLSNQFAAGIVQR